MRPTIRPEGTNAQDHCTTISVSRSIHFCATACTLPTSKTALDPTAGSLVGLQRTQDLKRPVPLVGRGFGSKDSRGLLPRKSLESRSHQWPSQALDAPEDARNGSLVRCRAGDPDRGRRQLGQKGQSHPASASGGFSS